MKLKISDYILTIVTAILGLIALIITFSIFSGVLPEMINQIVDPEVINGLLTVSGLIFAFQATYFRKPKKTYHKIIFTVVFLIEILFLGISGLSYVQDISNIGYITVNSLFVAITSLIYNIVITFFFVIVELFVLSSHEEKI